MGNERNKKIKIAIKQKQKQKYPIYDNVGLSYTDESFINYDIIHEVMDVVIFVCNTITDEMEYTDILNNINFVFLTDDSVVVIFDVKHKLLGLFLGKNYGNLFAIKRLLSNICGKLNYSGYNYSITVGVKQLSYE